MEYKVIGRLKNSSMCFTCGVNNKAGLNARFYHCQNSEGKEILLVTAKPKEHHQSYPNRMHGGVIASLLDEGIGRAMEIINPDMWAVTTELNVKYRKVVPLDQTIYIESQVTSETSRTYDASGKLFLADGTVCATATGRFFKCQIEQVIAAPENTDLFYVNEELPKEIIINPTKQ